MKISRDTTNIINWIIDNLIPPVLRDSKLVVYPFFLFLFGKKAKLFLEFKDKAPFLSKEEYEKYYSDLLPVHIKRHTCLNKKSIRQLLDKLEGKEVLEVGFGSGYFCKRIKANGDYKVTGIDIYVPKNLENDNSIRFIKGNTEKLPFADKSFDTVICAHVLEHVQNIDITIRELRRITKKRLLLVIPKQREYKYTFDLHYTFFPYASSIQRHLKNDKAKIELLDNDFLIIEDFA